MRTKIFASALGALTLAGQPAFATNMQGWEVNPVYENGQLTYCTASGIFRSGMSIGIMLRTDYQWGFIFGRDDWNLRVGSEFDAKISIDGVVIATGKAQALNSSFALQRLGDHAYQALRRGHAMQISTRGAITTLSLQGTYAALGALLYCVGNSRGQTASIGRGASPSKEGEQVPAAEALVIVSNILSSSGETGYQFAPPKGNIVKWTFADGTEGSFAAFRDSGGNADEAVSALISGISKGCAGDFVTAKKATPTTDGSVVRNITTACKIEGMAVVIRTSLVERRGLLLVFNHISVPGTELGGSEQTDSMTIDQKLAQQAVLTLPE